jgi:hypothetical protein
MVESVWVLIRGEHGRLRVVGVDWLGAEDTKRATTEPSVPKKR